MFAVLRTGGKQYKVQKDDVIKVEKLEGDAGKTIDLNEVLFLSDGKKATIGAPLVKGATVKAEVLEQKKDKKIVVLWHIKKQVVVPETVAIQQVDA